MSRKRALTDEQALEVSRLYYEEKMSQCQIARKMNVSFCTVNSILNRRVYKDLDIPDYKPHRIPKPPITDKNAYKALHMYFDMDMEPQKIADCFGVHRTCIYRILQGYSYQKVFVQFHADRDAARKRGQKLLILDSVI